MAGSGGYFSGRFEPTELAQKTREAELAVQDAVFETEIEKFLSDQLARYNDRNVNDTQRVFDAFKKDLQEEIEGTVDLLFGGSIQKHTYVDGLSDVDALVLFDRADIAKQTPADLKELLAETLRTRYGTESVRVGDLAVTLSSQGSEIQLVPAVREGDGFKISKTNGTGWSSIAPQKFAEALTEANRKMDNKLVPCIKLAKAIISTLPEQRQLTGYHTESLAIKSFRDYTGDKTPKAILHHFFERASTHVKEPIVDSSGQSVHVDGYLGVANSVQRRIIADSFERIARRMKNADGAKSVERWKEFFE